MVCFFNNDNAGFTRTYTYDKRGNITTAKTYRYTEGDLTDKTPTKAYTCSYKSGDDVWEDELVNATAIDENSSLLYDANGNPINYWGLDARWSAGRQLSKIVGLDDNGNEEAYASFSYDENGIRTSEQSIEDSLTFDFTTEDGAITGRQSADGKNYRFIYDESGKPTAFLMNGALYHYITNQMGDVVGVTDADGNLAVENFYDAWGDNYTSAIEECDFDGKTGWDGAYKLYNTNPMRYRGYYFDVCIGMYYLQSRYFNPTVNRFFNADDPDIAQQSKDIPVGLNLFAYCNNDPVNNTDPTGYKAAYSIKQEKKLSKIDLALLLVIFVSYYIEPKKLKNYDFWTSRLVIDTNGLAVAKISYRKSKKHSGPKSSFHIALSNHVGWEKYKEFDNNVNSAAINYHYECISKEMLKAGAVHLDDSSNLTTVQVSFVAMCCYLLKAKITASVTKKYYNKIWSKTGLSKQKKRYYMFHIYQGSKSINGWYAMRDSDGKVNKL